MADESSTPNGPDLTRGVALADLPDGGKLLGHAGGEQVLLLRRGAEVFAVAASCTHYSGPLADGLVVGETIRCPWHHACFDLRSGAALAAPALSPLACWSVTQRDGKVTVGKKIAGPSRPPSGDVAKAGGRGAPGRVVIVGGGAAGFAAAQRLRNVGFGGGIVMLSQEDAAPIDRPNLSKDYLAGSAPEDWIPLRPTEFYGENGIELRLGIAVAGIDRRAREVALSDGTRLAYDRLLLATGAEPVRLSIPGIEQPHVHVLRSLADCRAIIADAGAARRAVVLGASFIGLEVAAALRSRKIEVHVVAPEKRPMERILGAQMGDFVRAMHEEHGVVFHLEDTAVALDGKRVRLKSGGTVDAELVVAGVGVRPRTALAEGAGLAIERGVTVNAFLQTSDPDIYAAGDIARWPDPHSGGAIRVEHWVVAERQGQVAALNMIGGREAFRAVPFFWSQHYDVPINYVGHAEAWDELLVEGDIAAKDCLVRFKQKGRVLAVASIFRDGESLQTEAAMEAAT